MMGKANNQSDFFHRVYQVVARIPYGKVTTYGAIAEHLGIRSGARIVGWALNKTITQPSGEDLPAHRVVNRLGQLSGKRHFSGNVMEERLRQEGVVFLSPHTVDLNLHFWNPDQE